jgi:glycosyltransferase involved in cell wall biosynthesis
VRLLHLHDAPHVAGGASAYLRRVIEEAAGRGHAQWGWSLDEPIRHPRLEDARAFVYSWPSSPLRRRRDFHGRHVPLVEHLTSWIHTLSPDLIHVQNCAAFRNSVFPALRAAGVPVLMTVHDFSLADDNPSGRARRGLRGTVQRLLDRRSHARARAAAFEAVRLFLCPTEALRLGGAFPPAQARLQRLPIEMAESAPWPEPAGNKPLRLFFAGSLYRSKGVDLLLEALPMLGGAAAGATLEIAGAGDQADDLERRVRDAGLTAQVRFLGHCAPAEMERAYTSCDLLVLPSRVPENSPLTVLEAGARGRPAVASAAGGVPELLAEKRGWTFRSEDSADLARTLERAAADRAELRARGERMRAWVRRECEPRRHWDGLEAVRHELVARRTSR